LTMIPDWFSALDNALRILRVGGAVGVVDFYVSRKFPSNGLKRHSVFTRSFWPAWFGYDNVFLSPDHIPYLHRRFVPLEFEERLAKVPYVPFIRTPYYIFVGRKAE
jgi:S-adenosylmethionine-diacylgycerolhomoserine-N-methlytransferase